MEHFKLKAKKIQLISDIRNNADFVACLEEKNLVIEVDRASAKFPYKKIKCSSKDCTEIIVQSDGLKIIMNRHALFEERLEAAMNGVFLGGKLQQHGNKPANNSSSIETVAYPENRSAGNGNRIGKASHGAITSSSASSVTKRNVMSPGTGLSSSPLTTSLISQSLKRLDDGYIVTQRNSGDRAIRTETPSERTVNTVFNSRASKTEHGLPSNRGDLRENVVTSLKSASSPGWLDDECLDLSSNVPSDPQKHVVAQPILRVYSQKPNNAIQFLRGQTPDPTRKNLFAAYSISAQKTGSGNNNREVSSESSPYSRVYSTSSAAINTASRLGKLDLVVHSSKKQNTPSSPDSAWFTKDKEVVAEKRPVVVRPASNFFASFRQVHANSGSCSGNSSGINGSDSSSTGVAGSSNSKRIPGGIRNLGNSCYIGSILQV